MSVGSKELREDGLEFVHNVVTHYTLVAVSQQCGLFHVTSCKKKPPNNQYDNCLDIVGTNVGDGMDALVVVDAITQCMSYEDKELCPVGNYAVLQMLKTAASVLGSYKR